MSLVALKKLLSSDEGLIAGSLSNLAVRGSGAVLAFAGQVILARMLGVSSSGIFYLGLTLVMAACQIGSFGLHNTMIIFLSHEWERNKLSRVFGIGLQGVGISLLSGAAVCTVALTTIFFLSDTLSDRDGFAQVAQVMAFAIVPYGTILVLSGVLKAIKAPAQAILIETTFIPLLFLIFLLVCFVLNWELSPVLAGYFYVFAALITLVYALGTTSRKIGQHAPSEFISTKDMVSTAWPLMLASLMGFVVGWFSTICLGLLSTPHSLGLFSAAFRTASFLGFIHLAFNSIAAARFAVLYRNNDIASLQQLAIRSSTIMCCVALPLIIATTLVPDLILSIFGQEFSEAGVVLSILSIGQFICLLSGSADAILIMSGNGRRVREILTITTIVSLVSNWLLISYMDITGAALATFASVTLKNLLATYSVYTRLGIVVIPGGIYIQNFLGRK